MPTSIAAAAVSAALSTAGAFTLQAFAAAFVKAFAVNLILSGVSKALARDKAATPSLSFDSATRTQTVRQPIAPWRVVYGTDRVGGALTFACQVVGHNYVATVTTIACHRSKGIREVYFADEAVPLRSDGNADGRYNGYTRIRYSLGTEAGQPFEDLVGNSGGKWAESAWQKGHTKLHTMFYRDRAVFASGIPNQTALLDGYDQVYDPRTATSGFSSNPALCLANYLSNARFNKDAVTYATGIDETALIAAANVCDERVSTVYQPVITVTAATDTVTFAADEAQIKTGDAVKYASTGGAAGGLTSGSVYYAIRTDTDTAQLATTRANALAGVAIDLTSAGSGTQTLERMVVFTAAAGTDRLTLEVADLRIQRGDGVRLETTNTLPGGLATGTTYYVIPVTASLIQLATSYANAFADTAINITDAGTGTHRLRPYDEVRYATNGSFTLDQNPQDIIEQLVAPMAGRAVKIGGKWRITAGAYTAPSITFTDTDMDGPRQVQVMPGRDQNANGMRGVFVGPENFFQPTDFVPVTNATYLTVDAGERVWRDVEFGMVRRESLARRLAKIELERTRQGLSLTLQGKISTYRVQPGDIIGVTVSRYGWSNKAFEVINSKLVVRGEGDNLRFGVDHMVRETASAVFTWTATENSAADLAPNTTLPDPFARAREAPPNVSGLEVFGQGNDTEFAGRDCKFAWRRNSAYFGYEFGSEPQDQGAGAGSLDPWFAGWVVKVFKTDGTLLREEPPTFDPVYVYTHEKNFEDTAGSPVRTFRIEVRGKTALGKLSEIPAQLTVSNPAPVVSSFTTQATPGGFSFSFSHDSDTDYAGIRIYADPHEGFTPASANLIYQGSKLNGSAAVPYGGTTYRLRYVPFDVFGDGSTSSEVAVETLNPLAPSQLAALSRIGIVSTELATAMATLFGFEPAMMGHPVYDPTTGNLILFARSSGTNTLWVAAVSARDHAKVKCVDSGVACSTIYIDTGETIRSSATGTVFLTINTDATPKIVEIDPATLSVVWSATPGEVRYALSDSPVDGLVLFGGQDGGGAGQLDMLNPATHSWGASAVMPTATNQPVGCAYMPSADAFAITSNIEKKTHFYTRALSLSSSYTHTGTPTLVTRAVYVPSNDRVWVLVAVSGPTYRWDMLDKTNSFDASVSASAFPESAVFCPLNASLVGGLDASGYKLVTWNPVKFAEMTSGYVNATYGPLNKLLWCPTSEALHGLGYAVSGSAKHLLKFTL